MADSSSFPRQGDDPIVIARNFIASLQSFSSRPFKGHDASLLSSFHVTSATYNPKPTVATRLTITPSLLNSLGNLHGGATATIFDCCTSLALSLVRKEGFWELCGVSRVLNVIYLQSVGNEEEIEVVGEVVSVGKRMAHLRGEMRRVRDGGVVATCVHEKVNVGMEKARL